MEHVEEKILKEMEEFPKLVIVESCGVFMHAERESWESTDDLIRYLVKSEYDRCMAEYNLYPHDITVYDFSDIRNGRIFRHRVLGELDDWDFYSSDDNVETPPLPCMTALGKECFTQEDDEFYEAVGQYEFYD